MIKKLFIGLFIISLCGFTTRSVNQLPDTITISKEEQKLYKKIMSYRKLKGLPKITLSKSLTFVAQTHCRDLFENHPHKKSQCNLHSWSDKGKWTSCCYTRNHKYAEFVWSKPSELTNYKGHGYEISTGPSSIKNDKNPISPKQALISWKNSKSHREVILNNGNWSDLKWKAIGIGIYNGYACVWFGTETDPDGSPSKK